MKKWVIKQPRKDAPLEIWEYIDTVEEAMEYPWVAQAIRKYGANKVVPLAMNKFGGYHSLPADSPEVVEIIISEEPPKISVYKLYPVNAQSIHNGWMNQNGTTFSCGAYGHIRCAEKLVEEFNISEIGTIHADDALLEHGWIKIANRRWYGRWGKINDKQIQVLDELGLMTSSLMKELINNVK